MNNFSYCNPTKLIFGKDTVQSIAHEVPLYGKKVLLVYGGGSIKRNNLYDAVLQQLHEAGAEDFELAGVEPNPRITSARKGVEICKEQGIEFLLAVGDRAC